MRKIYVILSIVCNPFFVMAQPNNNPQENNWQDTYRASAALINDLVHTKLEVNFDYDKSWMYGKAWITLKPHFYTTDSVSLDAKGMDIKVVALVNQATINTSRQELKYQYDGMQLKIKLNKSYKANEKYTLYIDYISKPNELKVQGSDAITDAKGLYFINPKGEEENKPTQIWTQGETEANSVWMPTIDKPNQKTTQEIYMTVPSKYVTLSNGSLISQKQNNDGTRTDYWKMDLPHAPYLFFMGVGEYAIVKDKYKNKEVNYYVEKEYEPVAKKIFGHTPEMMKFYSDKLGVEYPWPKYSQIVGRDYVSGAMENTTATLHQESAYQNARELTDGIKWEGTIAHELFHQWFGDLVTAESWSNLTVNESFANYSEVLWSEYKFGKDAADELNEKDMQEYIISDDGRQKDLVRYKYADKENMFDVVSYNKGGRILHMLRNYVGDEAFFKSLNNYLTTNKFKTGEAAQLRLAFEEVTGQDLHWFWDQWYYGNDHPELKINYNYDDVAGKVTVDIEQNQKSGKIFRLPIAIDVYTGKDKKRHKVWIENKSNSFTFEYSKHPDLINVDADKILLCTKTDNKTAENYKYQIKNTSLYLDRKEALDFFAQNNMAELAEGLKDKYAPLRKSTIEQLLKSKVSSEEPVINAVEKLANTEKDKKTKAAAIAFLATRKDTKYKSLYEKNISDSSYSVAGESLQGLNLLEPDKSYDLAKKYTNDAKGKLGEIASNIIISKGDEADFDFIAKTFKEMPLSIEKVERAPMFFDYLEKINNIDNLKRGISISIDLRNAIPNRFKKMTDPLFQYHLDRLSKTKGDDIKKYIIERWK